MSPNLTANNTIFSCDDDGIDTPDFHTESREVVLAKRRVRRLAERLAKPAYVNSDACCRDGMAGLAYESALLGNRTALVPCADITLAEHLALLMAMHDAASRLPGRVLFALTRRPSSAHCGATIRILQRPSARSPIYSSSIRPGAWCWSRESGTGSHTTSPTGRCGNDD